MSASRPRVVLVTRKTPFELLVERHGTTAQAAFYLQSRGQHIGPYLQAHNRFREALDIVRSSLPPDQRRTQIDRGDLDRFLFSPDDIVVMVGQDGLVANSAKYLRGQTAIGINPDPQRYDGVLCCHRPEQTAGLLAWAEKRSGDEYVMQRRVMAAAEREDGQRLLALNEIFVGHRTHQSALYIIRVEKKEERQSSSGVICSTGTGATGWARSIAAQRGIRDPLPRPHDPALIWFVREPFPTVRTFTTLNYGHIKAGGAIEMVSEMGNDGVIFADGIESDCLEFLDGHTVRVAPADVTLNLVIPGHRGKTAKTRK